MGAAALAILTSERLVISASPTYIHHVGRERDAIIGHDYLPWIDPRDRQRSAEGFARAVADFEPRYWTSRVVRAGSILVLQQTTVMPFRLDGSRTGMFCSICPIKVLTADDREALDSQVDVVNYVEDLTSGLARMANRVGLFDLGQTRERGADHAATAGAQIEEQRSSGSLH